MQPWRFVIVRSEQTKVAMQAIAARERLVQSAHFAERTRQYLDLKIEGIREAPISICVCCDRDGGRGEVLGRHTIRDTDLYSTCLAIQNLWLAARAEGVGVGWVSFYRPDDVRALLSLPDSVVPVAWLCVGYPDERPTREQVVSDAERLLKAIGMEKSQYVLAAHKDTDDFHAHVIANRIGPDGRANDLWHERIKRERVCAEIAAERGWAIVVGHHNRDIVQRVDGSWARRRLQGLEIPSSVADSVLQRVARLSPDARQVMRAAAVLGVPATAGLLSRAARLEGCRRQASRRSR